MKFGDKLILLRKKNNLSQEELAEKLGVSRQSVSKWESNNSYPETDKIVQICNLFNCSMDDLINDKITDIESIERKDKNNFNIAVDSFLDFITKTINMFSDMKFTSGLKCVIEMLILIFILFIIGAIVVNSSTKLIENIFYFVPGFNEVLHYTINSIIKILYIIVSIIILVHVFKIRYLNYYEKVIDNNEDISDNKKIKFEKKDKIIIRDESHRPFAFLSVLSNIIIFLIKFLLVFIAIGLVFSLVFLVIGFIISLFLTSTSLLFFGSDLAIIASILINLVLLIFIINFIFNKGSKYKQLLVIFLASLIILGVGIAISTINIKNIDLKEYDLSSNITKEENVSYNENLVVVAGGLHDIEYNIDESMNDNIKVLINYNDKFNNYKINKDDNYYGLNTYEIHIDDNVLTLKDLYNIYIPNLKNNTILYNYSNYKITVVSTSDIINKLINNTDKAYVFEKEEINNGYILKNIKHKIQKTDYCYEKTDYNVVTGEITTSNNCKCEVSNEEEYINFTCDYIYEE